MENKFLNHIDKIPTLPLRDVVVFPDMIFPLFVGRKKSVKALEAAMASDKKVFLVTQKNPATDNVLKQDIYRVGVVGNVVQMLKLPDGTLKILIDTRKRAELINFYNEGESFLADIEMIDEIFDQGEEYGALLREIKQIFKKYVRLEERIPSDLITAILEISDPAKLADHVVSSLPIKLSEKQDVLSEINVKSRLELAYKLLKSEYQILDTEGKIKNRIKSQVENSQREYYLNEQLKAIKKELGNNNGQPEEGEDEILQFEKLIESKKLSKEAKTKAQAELKKLKAMNPMSSEAGIVRSYLEWLLHLPWQESTKLQIDLKKAEDVLNDGHYGLEKVKERILEFIAVNRRVKKIRGSILCLVGPPGVGKTSLARSIAKAMGREFVKMSLGGVRDEAEIRGHRRTYIGALPGKVIQQIKKVKVSNPLFLLDEIDKMGQDYRGDPASALLEVLDPEQNTIFNDHYLEVDYDLSEVMFLTTANSLDIPHALRDRMEVIRLSGYTEAEKLEISKRHLLPKQTDFHGLEKGELKISDAALIELIRNYTYEAGVRNLEREIANLARKSTRKIDSDAKLKSVNLTPKNLDKFAGVAKFSYGRIEETNLVGVTTGLAYTEFGGDILSIEAVKTPGEGKITFTGKLGDVMKESMQAAYSFFKSRSEEFGVKPELFKKYDIHIHVPEGATPKDGPSAGTAICTSIASLLTEIPVDRHVAMTGEITLRGRVLPIGGLKEKLLAALRAGIKKVLIPKKNEKDLVDIPANIVKDLELVFVDNFSEVVKEALVKPTKPSKSAKGKKFTEDESTVAATH